MASPIGSLVPASQEKARQLVTLTAAILILLAGICGGVMSAIAGGASFFTFPVLMFVGLPSIVANASNFVGLVPANTTALPAFRHELRRIGLAIWPCLVAAITGGAAGAMLLLATEETTFRSMVPFLLLAATVMFAFGPRVRSFAKARRRGGLNASSASSLAMIFVLSIYGGYFGAGVGMMLLSVLNVFGYDDIHEANAVKNLLIAAFSLVAVAIYGFSSAISWPHALTLMVGAAIGGYLGGFMSRRLPERPLRLMIIAIGLALSIAYMMR
jgi:uncharacterized membrane protein YfcA